MLLKNKVAVVYGAGGAIGGAVARAFAAEGARLFLTGRGKPAVEAVAKDIVAAGGVAEVAKVDALDEQAIEKHMQSVIDKAGRVDISFNAIGIPDREVVGTPLMDLDVEKFMLPVEAYVTSYFLTARAAARRMTPNKSGVIMTVTALPARVGSPMIGGYSPALAAKEGLTRGLSRELASLGIRVLSLRPHAIPESESIQEVYNLKAAKVMSWEQWQDAVASNTHTRRLTRLAEVGHVAAFAASDKASGLTGTVINLSMGNVDD